MKFWDASAIVPLLVAEPTTRPLQVLAGRDPEMLVWWGSEVECSSALARLERAAALDMKGDLTRLRPAQTAGCRMARNRTQRDCSRKCNPISSRSSAASGRRTSAGGGFHGCRTAPGVAPNCHARRASRRRRAQGRVRVGRCRAGLSTARGLGHYSRATLFKLLDSKDLVRGSPAGGDYGDQDEILVRLVPAVGEAGFDDERHRQFAMWRTGAFHDHFRDLGGRASFGLGHLEQ